MGKDVRSRFLQKLSVISKEAEMHTGVTLLQKAVSYTAETKFHARFFVNKTPASHLTQLSIMSSKY